MYLDKVVQKGGNTLKEREREREREDKHALQGVVREFVGSVS